MKNSGQATQDKVKDLVWTLVSPKPPPRHGASRAVEILLEGPTQGVEWKHVDATYTTSIAELQKASISKFVLLVKYLWQMILSGRKSDGVVLTPSFQVNTFMKDSLFVWIAKIFVRKPIVAWYHMRFETMEYSSLGGWMKWYVEKTLKCISAHVCVAPSLLKGMPEFLAEDSLFSVANGIPELGLIPQSEARSMNSGSPGLKILYVSNFTENKGWRLLREVAEELCSENESLEFDFFGAPTGECPLSELQEVFLKGSDPQKVRYCGILEDGDKSRVFNEADILAFPSFNEAFPITLLEAMSVGLPIVATEVGGISDAVLNDKGGLIVPAKDKTAFKAALSLMIQDFELRKRFGEFNMRRFENSFTSEAFCQSWAELLKDSMMVVK